SLLTSASPVGGVTEWAEQQRHMVMLLVVGYLEDDGDVGIEALAIIIPLVTLDIESDSVDSKLQLSLGQPVGNPSVLVGYPICQLLVAAVELSLKFHLDTGRGAPASDV